MEAGALALADLIDAHAKDRFHARRALSYEFVLAHNLNIA